MWETEELVFTVDPEALDAWSARLSGLTDDAQQAARYADAHLRFDGAGWEVSPAFSEVVNGMDEARAALVASAGRLGELLDASAAQLASGADVYRSTDRAEAARLDALLDEPSTTTTPPAPRAPSAAAVEDPAAALQPPTASDPIPDPLESVLSLTDWISPAHLVMELLELICGTNPLEWVAEQVAGDWTRLSIAADACEKLATFDSAMGGTIGGSADLAFGGNVPWRGEAADAAGVYFAGLAGSVDDQAGPVGSFGRQCQALAAAVYTLSQGLVDLLKFLIDLATGMAISAAANAVPLVGTIVAGVASAVVIAQAVKTWEKVLDTINNMFGAAKLFVGLAGSFAGSLRELSQHRLPAGAYDHPGV